MKPHFDRATRNFGSFMCLTSLPRIFLDDSDEVRVPGMPGQIVIESAEDDRDNWLGARQAGRRYEFWNAGAGI